MTLLLTKEEWKYIVIKPKNEYAFECAKDAPTNVKGKIQKQLDAHKKWLGMKNVT